MKKKRMTKRAAGARNTYASSLERSRAPMEDASPAGMAGERGGIPPPSIPLATLIG
jgi:hypothetical protein